MSSSSLYLKDFFFFLPDFTCGLYIFLVNFFICRFLGFYIGKRGVTLIVGTNILIALLVSLCYLYLVLQHNTALPLIYTSDLGIWFNVADVYVSWTFFLDYLSCTMAVMVTAITLSVIYYSFDYMWQDPYFIRFISYLNLFAFFMLILVYSSNLFVLFLGWDGVGLCSFLLVSFWTTRIQAAKAGLKALLFNRIGDFFLFLAICATVKAFGTSDFFTLFSLAPYLTNASIQFFTVTITYLELIVFCFVIGAVGKSAQIGLHLWLPDAMEGPTPVSALIHAATMVTAGLYLLIRCSFILVLVPSVFYIIVILGSCTVVFSSLVALVQYDLKKIISYSTCSQLGYMFLTIGLSNFTLSYYHLLTHAYFKALLFLTAGSIIHFFNGEQDIRKLGGLLKIAPYYYLVFLIGNLSLFGFFFTSGFYSKENLLSFVLNSSNNSYVYFCSLLALIMTACTILYSIRLFYYLFFNNTNSFYSMYIRLSKLNVATNELYVLLFLALCSIIVGYLYQDLFLENSLFFSSSIASEHITIFTADFVPTVIKLLPFFFLLIIILNYIVNPYFFLQLSVKNFFITHFLLARFFFDSIIAYFSALIFLLWSRRIFLYLDKGLLEIIGPYGFFFVFTGLSKHIHFSLSEGSLLQNFYYLLTGCFTVTLIGLFAL